MLYPMQEGRNSIFRQQVCASMHGRELHALLVIDRECRAIAGMVLLVGVVIQVRVGAM